MRRGWPLKHEAGNDIRGERPTVSLGRASMGWTYENTVTRQERIHIPRRYDGICVFVAVGGKWRT